MLILIVCGHKKEIENIIRNIINYVEAAQLYASRLFESKDIYTMVYHYMALFLAGVEGLVS